MRATFRFGFGMLSAMDGKSLTRVLYEPDRDESGAVTVPGIAVVGKVSRRMAAPGASTAALEAVVGDVGASISGLGDRCVRVSVTDAGVLREAALEAGLGVGEGAARSGLSSLLAEARRDELTGNPAARADVYCGFVALRDQERGGGQLRFTAQAAYRGAHEVFQVEIRDGAHRVMAMVDAGAAEELLRRWMDGDATLLSDPRWRRIDG